MTKAGIRRVAEKDMERWSEWFAWRDPADVLPDDAFDCPGNHERPPRTALGRFIHDGAAAAHMAGSAFRPGFVEFAEFVMRPTQTAVECGYIHELFLQLHPLEAKLMSYNMGVTTFELARALRNSGVHNAFVVDWINSYAPDYSTPRHLRKIADHWGDDRLMPLISREVLKRLGRVVV